MGYIYKITNMVNNKVYIGQTKKSVQERFKIHLSNAKRHINRYLYDAMNHYGYESFVVEQIEECSNNLLDDRERFWIKYYNSTDSNKGYNMTTGGGGGNTWTINPHKELTIQRMFITKIKNGTMIPKEIKDKLKEDRKKEQEKLKRTKEEKEKEEILKFAQYPYSTLRFCEEIGISQHTLFNRCKKYFNCTPSQFREVKLVPKKRTLTEKYWQNHKGAPSGKDNPNYVDMEIDELKELIIQGYNRADLAKHFNTSKATISHKISKYFGKELRLVRKELLKENG